MNKFVFVKKFHERVMLYRTQNRVYPNQMPCTGIGYIREFPALFYGIAYRWKRHGRQFLQGRQSLQFPRFGDGCVLEFVARLYGGAWSRRRNCPRRQNMAWWMAYIENLEGEQAAAEQ